MKVIDINPPPHPKASHKNNISGIREANNNLQLYKLQQG
jgi:hypothetical protein